MQIKSLKWKIFSRKNLFPHMSKLQHMNSSLGDISGVCRRTSPAVHGTICRIHFAPSTSLTASRKT